MDINNKRIVLTGASSGIGKETLTLLLEYRNVQIIAVARHIEEIKAIDNQVIPYSADVSNQEGVDKLFEFARQTFGDIDIFIANAGFAYLEQLNLPDWQHIENIFNLNVFSPIYALEKLVSGQGSKDQETMTNERLPVKRQPGGELITGKAFVFIISGAGLASLPGYSLYCSSKAALHHFVNTYRYEKLEQLQITSVYPVATRTGFFDKATGKEHTPLPFPVQKARTVAQKIVKGIEQGKEIVYPSLLFRIGYPIGRAFPVFLHWYSMREKRKIDKWFRKNNRQR